MKYLIVLVAVILSGCGTISHPPGMMLTSSSKALMESMPETTSIETDSVAVVSESAQEEADRLFNEEQAKMAALDASFGPAGSAMMARPAPNQPKPNVKTKILNSAKAIMSALVSTAEAATLSSKETLQYDTVGEVKAKTVEIVHESLVSSLTKIVAMVTGALAMWAAWKKFKVSRRRKKIVKLK